MLILFNLHIFAAVIVLYSDFCEFSLLYRGDLLYRGTLPQHLIQKLLIGRILLSVPDILHINPGSLYIGMSERLRYDRHVHRGHESQRSPGVARYIEYKNKTQEKCNYCTIYQCISGFYKKNVELHLLLILAIDSVIYSFYVTILLCKKAPVFD